MGTTELAFVGLAGSGIGAVLSVPMVWPLSRRPIDMRLIGVGLLGLSIVAAIISKARVKGPLFGASRCILSCFSILVRNRVGRFDCGIAGLCGFPPRRTSRCGFCEPRVA